MSNDDFPPPTPSDGSETGLGDLASGPGEGAAFSATPPHGTAQPPPIDSTQMMPVTPTLPPSSPGVPPPPIGGTPSPAPGAPGVPPGGIVPAETVPEAPWFKRPGAVAGVVTTVLLIGGVIALLFLLGRDDDGGSELTPDPVSFVITRSDGAGAPLDTTLTATVRTFGPAADA